MKPVSFASTPTDKLSPEITCSPSFPGWLESQKISLAFSTYQTNRVFFIGLTLDGKLSVTERFFDRPMGLYASASNLFLTTRYQLWQLESIPEIPQKEDFDRIYIPRLGYTTGDVNAHEIALASDRQSLLFVNTLFSCIATLHPQYHFNPIWQPPFISKLAPEDRCHLNGMAMKEGKPRYVTACSSTNTAAGWRQYRQNGGVIIDVESNEIACTGLSMPHSPRLYNDKLWVLNSGTGFFGYVDLNAGKFQPVVFCPGFVRGLAFYKNFAIVGLSQPRHDNNFQGLVLDEQLAANRQIACCGFMVIDLTTGKILHQLIFNSVVKELFDVVVLPEVRQAIALGFQTDEIERLVTFPNSGGIISTRPSVQTSSAAKVTIAENVETSPSSLLGNPVEELGLGTVAARFDRGRQLQKQGKLEEAEACFREAIALQPDYLAAYNNLGNLLQVQGKIPEAIAILSRAVQIAPQSAIVHCNLASAQLLAGNLEAAKSGYQQALRLDANFYLAHLNLGKLYASRREIASAEGHFREVLRLQPDNAEVRKVLDLLLHAQPQNQTSPKVSLIMTAYNTATYIEQAIASVVAQTYQNWELIIWDDGSSDETPAIAQSQAEKDQRIRYYRETHRGYNRALHSAFSLACGEYIGAVDSDDILAPTALENTVQFLEANPSYGVVYTDRITIDSQGQNRGLDYRCQIPYSPERLLVDFITFHFRLMRKEIFEAVGGIVAESEVAEDYDLCLRLSEVTQIHHLSQPLYYYRVWENQMSQQQRYEQMKASERAINRAIVRRNLADTYYLEVEEESGKFSLRSRKLPDRPAVKYQRVYHLNAANSIEYDAVTFPSIKKRWRSHDRPGELIGVSASVSEQLVGMAIAEILPNQTAELISLFVSQGLRQQGIGGNLVKFLEKGLTENQVRVMDVKYQVTDLTNVALEPLLKQRAWQPPKAVFILAQTTTEKISQAPWLYKYPLPESFEIFPWVSLTQTEKQIILARKDYPEALNPFSDDSRVEPLNSLGLRYQGEVIGWMVTHRVAPDTIRYSSLFVGQKFQKLGRGISLIAESIKRQMASDVSNYTCSVALENPLMIQFVKRHLRPYLTGMGESRQSIKLL
ncbi:TIGR03032 family protein [Microcoleus sp. BROC3]|uniref:TIGR03032 family protein n=1 Tax=Microcoleus sp. BROC3 TaxID=3055323 RepID=UPI002FD419EB